MVTDNDGKRQLRMQWSWKKTADIPRLKGNWGMLQAGLLGDCHSDLRHQPGFRPENRKNLGIAIAGELGRAWSSCL